MKAVIVEVKGKFVAALSEDGSFVRLKNAHYVLGQQIEVPSMALSRTKLLVQMAKIAACCLLVCGLGGGIYAYETPAYYVSMDVNPSIAYTLNTFERVLSVRAVNDDGEKILQDMNLADFNNKRIDEAMILTLAEITREGYFDGDMTGGIVIATSGKESGVAESLAVHLKALVTAQCTENKRTVSVEALVINQTQMDEAEALGVTPGKLLLVQTLLQEHPEARKLSTEQWLKKPIKDILYAYDEEDDIEDESDTINDAEDTAGADQEDVPDAFKNVVDDEENATEEMRDVVAEQKDAAEDAKDVAEEANEADEASTDSNERADSASHTAGGSED